MSNQLLIGHYFVHTLFHKKREREREREREKKNEEDQFTIQVHLIVCMTI